MIVDVFTFFNELDLLEYRLEYMYPLVDKIVIVEGNVSFAGKPKRLFFQENQSRFERFLDKIVYHIAELPMSKEELDKFDRSAGMNRYGDSWIRENAQRQACKVVLEALGLKDDDIVIFTDLDEIPNVSRLLTCFKADSINRLVMHFFYQCIHLYLESNWSKPYAVRYGIFKQYDPDMLRLSEGIKHSQNRINDCGWHFSYFGNVQVMQEKITNFSHQEEAVQKFNELENLKDAVKNHRCYHHGPYQRVLNDDMSDFGWTKPPGDISRFAYCKQVL